MKKTTTRSEQPIVTRAAKKDAVKNLIRELLTERSLKHNDLIEAAANVYAQRFAGEDTENINDVRGRIGSVLDIMKKEEEVLYDGGMYALKTVNAQVEKKESEQETAKQPAKTEKKEKAVKSKTKKSVKSEGTPMEAPVKEEKTEEKPVEKKTKKRSVKGKKTSESEEKQEEEVLPLPPAPIQPIAPVAPVMPEIAPEPMPESKPAEEKPAPKKRGKKAAVKKEEQPKAEEQKQEPKTEKDAPMSVTDEKTAEETQPSGTPLTAEEPTQTAKEEKAESVALVQKPRAEVAEKNIVMDMSFLFGNVQKEEKQPPKPAPKKEAPLQASASMREKAEVKEEKPVVIAEEKAEEKPVQKTEEQPVKPNKTVVKQTEKTERPKVQPQTDKRRLRVEKMPAKPLSADEKLREAFLRKIRSLGGDYFEYYSVYLLERYSRKNGRRLEGLKVTGGGHDGGIDGEIELTDRLGFKETIYIQSKNWNPEKGDERLWVVGETLLQQFIGACACRQAKDGKQHCRGIFITTSRFTPDAKRILDAMSDKIVGYDSEDLYEAAKECEFGVVKKNGSWVLDEELLSGEKAFFNMF